MSKRAGWLAGVVLLAVALALVLLRAEAQAQRTKNKTKEVWTDLEDKTLPVDYKFQGEYVTNFKGAGAYGAQVIALGKGTFQAVVLPGGLPGAGWDGKNKILLDGRLNGDKVTFSAVELKDGKRRYKQGGLGIFSATSKFPPVGHQEMTGTLADDKMSLESADGKALSLARTVRKSPTMGAKPPAGAIVLFDGTSKDAFTAGRVDKTTGLLNTDGNDIRTKQKFNNYTAHLEFFLPYRPDAQDQGRGNSGFYQVDMYEVQILDSFGLDGRDNECGGIYTRAASKLNMCLPPLQWQTYDIEFTNAVQDAAGKKVKNARATVKLNGVVIHDDVEIKGKTGGARGDAEGTPGPLQLQGHGNPLQFRNFWVVEKK